MSDYTPTTEEVRGGWISNCWEFTFSDTTDMDYEEQFDRWLAAHDEKVIRWARLGAWEVVDKMLFGEGGVSRGVLRSAILDTGKHEMFDDCWEGGSIAICLTCSASGRRIEWPCAAARGDGERSE